MIISVLLANISATCQHNEKTEKVEESLDEQETNDPFHRSAFRVFLLWRSDMILP